MKETGQVLWYNFDTRQYESDVDLTKDEIAEQFIPQTRRELYRLHRAMGKDIKEAMVETLKFGPRQA